MISQLEQSPHLVIACGGTGGHLFPGVAVGAEWLRRGGRATLVVSEKEIDQVALQGETRFRILKLPALGTGQGSLLAIGRGLWRSYRTCCQSFAELPPQAVLAMGGFTSVAPILAGRRHGAALFLHDSNAIPGRANRWLSLLTDEAFVGFEQARAHLRTALTLPTGTPVRPQFSRPESPAPARVALGLDPLRPVLLVMGGSQGARGINDATLQALPTLQAAAPELQFLHLTGAADAERVQARYQELQIKAVVRPFLAEMHLALAAADLVISRAGASSLAEFAAMGLPAILIPYPSAADDHQTANAEVFVQQGAALRLSQRQALAGQLANAVISLWQAPTRLAEMKARALAGHVPDAAQRMVDRIESCLRFHHAHGRPGANAGSSRLFCANS